MSSAPKHERLSERVTFRVTSAEKARFFAVYDRAARSETLRRAFLRLVKRGESK